MKLTLTFQNGIKKKLEVSSFTQAQVVVEMHRVKSFKLKGKS